CSSDFPVCTAATVSGTLAVETTAGHVDVAVSSLTPGQYDFTRLPALEFARGTVLSGRFLGTMSPTTVDVASGQTGIAVSSTVSSSSTIVPNANEVVVLAAHAPLDSAEVYAPGTGNFTGADSLVGGPRTLHTATPLSTGEVLIAGGTADETTAYVT